MSKWQISSMMMLHIIQSIVREAAKELNIINKAAYSLDKTGIISKRTSCKRLQEKAKTMLKMIWTKARFSSYSL